MAINYIPSQSGLAAGGSGSVTTFTLTLSNAVSPGSAVCIGTGGNPSAGIATAWTLTDNVSGNTYTRTAYNISSDYPYQMAIFYGENIQGSPTRFTLHATSGNSITYPGILLDTFTGILLSSALDDSSLNFQNNPGTGTDAITSTALNPTASGDLIWGMLIDVGSEGSNSVGTGFTLGQTDNATFYSEYILSGPHSSIAATFTSPNGAADLFSAGALALKAAPVTFVSLTGNSLFKTRSRARALGNVPLHSQSAAQFKIRLNPFVGLLFNAKTAFKNKAHLAIPFRVAGLITHVEVQAKSRARALGRTHLSSHGSAQVKAKKSNPTMFQLLLARTLAKVTGFASNGFGIVFLRSSAGTIYTSRTNTVVPAPSLINNGDILVLHFCVGNTSSITATPPTGFNPVPGPSFPIQDGSSGSFPVNNYTWYKLASNESGSYTVTHATGRSQAWIASFANADQITPFGQNESSATSETGIQTIVTGITTTRNGSLFTFISQDFANAQNNLAGPTGYMTQFDVSLAGGESLLYTSTFRQSTAGPSGTLTVTNNNITTNPWAGFLLAIQPVASSAVAMLARTAFLVSSHAFVLGAAAVHSKSAARVKSHSVPFVLRPLNIKAAVKAKTNALVSAATALRARSVTQFKTRGIWTQSGFRQLLATSLSAVKSRVRPYTGTTGLRSAGKATSTSRVLFSGSTRLLARSAAKVKVTAVPFVGLLLRARIIAMAKGRSVLHGARPLLIQSSLITKSAAKVLGHATMLSRGIAAIKASALTHGTLPLRARSSTKTKGKGQTFFNLRFLFASSRSAVKGHLVSTGTHIVQVFARSAAMLKSLIIQHNLDFNPNFVATSYSLSYDIKFWGRVIGVSPALAANIEGEIVNFDFNVRLPTGVIVVSINSLTVQLAQGFDPNPSNVLFGSPSFSGNVVSQPVFGGVGDCTYVLTCVVNCSDALKRSIIVSVDFYEPY